MLIRRDDIHRAHWRELDKRRERLPRGHPLFDAQDLPKRWQRWFAEGAGAVVIVLMLLPVCYAAQHLHGVLPALLGRLSALVR